MGDRRSGNAAAEHLGAVDVPGGDVGARALAGVSVLHAHRPIRRRNAEGVFSPARLNAGLFVSAEDEVPVGQWLALQTAPVEIEDGARLGGELRIPPEHPAAVGPGLDGVFVQPRRMVVPPMSATIPRSMASRRMSARLRRNRGRPVSWGISHASALTGVHHVGGKSPRASRPGLVAETGHGPFEEPLAPLADDLARRVQTLADRLVGQAVGDMKDDPGPQDLGKV